VAESLRKAFTSPSSLSDATRLSGLTALFNIAPQIPSLRCRLLLDVLSFGSSPGTDKAQARLVLGMVRPNVDAWVSKWQLSTEDQKSIYLSIAQVERNAGSPTHAVLAAVVRGMEVDQQSCPSDVAHLESAARLYLADATHFECDLVALPAFEQLAKPGSLCGLLKDVVHGDVARVQAGVSTSAAAAAAVSQDALVEKTRLCALLSCAEQARGSPVQYAEVARVVGLPLDAVETFIVKAVGKGIVEAKMDQMAETVSVSRWTQRVFDKQSWGPVKAQLAMWSDNLKKAADIVHKVIPTQLPPSLATPVSRTV